MSSRPPNSTSDGTGNVAPVGIVFELALGLAGALLAKWYGLPIREWLTPESGDLVRGVLATLPMLALFAATMVIAWGPLVRLRERVQGFVSELFAESNLPQLAALALAAGVGEEILFRGAIQPIVAEWTSPVLALVIASFLFGAVHAATPTYFIVATLVGMYLGWLFQQWEDLSAPIIAHGLYDFVALWWLRSKT
ncbi:MAG: CPBP family intramembrane glutamic endopeptidase [Lacipirellulaceae bacterium]